MLLLTLRGTPLLYYGDEIGMTDVSIPPESTADSNGRDPARTPMQWDATGGAGFTTGRPWLPIPASALTVNVAVERDEPGSLLNLYRDLIGLRREQPVRATVITRYSRRPSRRCMPTSGGPAVNGFSSR